MKKTPFKKLLDDIENELYNHTLEIQLKATEGESINWDFVLGYHTALVFMRDRARGVLRMDSLPSGHDFGTSAGVADYAIRQLKKG